MAVRVENSTELDFGIVLAAVTVTHIRCQRTADTDDKITIDADDRVTQAGRRLKINARELDFLWPDGSTGISRHLNRTMVDEVFANEPWQVDLMTDASTPVSVSGYSQQSHSAWRITEEND